MIQFRNFLQNFIPKHEESEILGSHGGNYKCNVFCDVKPFSLVDPYQRFEGTYCLNPEVGRRRFLLNFVYGLPDKIPEEINLRFRAYIRASRANCFTSKIHPSLDTSVPELYTLWFDFKQCPFSPSYVIHHDYKVRPISMVLLSSEDELCC